MVHFFRLCYCSSGSSCTFSSLVNTKLFEMLLYEKKNSQASFRHTVSLPLFPQWPLHHLGVAVTPSLILRGYISSWHLSPFIACAGVSLALPKKRAHTHTQTLTSTPLANGEIQRGVEEGKMLSSSYQWLIPREGGWADSPDALG